MFQRVAALRPSAVPAATATAAVERDSAVGTSPMPSGRCRRGRAARAARRRTPVAEYAVELKREATLRTTRSVGDKRHRLPSC